MLATEDNMTKKLDRFVPVVNLHVLPGAISEDCGTLNNAPDLWQAKPNQLSCSIAGACFIRYITLEDVKSASKVADDLHELNDSSALLNEEPSNLLTNITETTADDICSLLLEAKDSKGGLLVELGHIELATTYDVGLANFAESTEGCETIPTIAEELTRNKDLSPYQLGKLDSRLPNTTGAGVDQDTLTFLEPGDLVETVPSCNKDKRNGSCISEADGIGDGYHIAALDANLIAQLSHEKRSYSVTYPVR
ncbi:hypothetical protein HG530_001219 [Fusarium avenaceum]|nr:hypothetical protein HG530_001219 [Fusarium avenaceum]